MKRRIAAMVVAVTLLGSSGAWAVENVSHDYEDSITHPLRIASYLAHPVGFALEWLVGRPFHYIISRPGLDNVFGYEPYEDQGQYRRYGTRL